MKDLLSVTDLTGKQINSLIREAIKIKKDAWHNVLERKILGLTFEKPSLRTRVSFEVAMRQLGGSSVYLSPAEIGLGKRESVADVARVLCRFVDAIAARTFSHQTVVELAKYSRVPVINALSDIEHPCQALADLMTIYEKKGNLKKLAVAYIGDGNNVATSLMMAAALTGMDFRIAAPKGYEISHNAWGIARGYAAESGTDLFASASPRDAVSGADVIYTDVWTSMGQETEAEQRRHVFAGYQITQELAAQAKPDAIIMHPLPAHHGEEVAYGMLETPASVVFDQAENRLHTQKALLVWLLGGQEMS